MSDGSIHPLAGKPAPESVLVDVSRLVAAYHSDAPDVSQAEENLKQSLALARRQGALGYELRTAIVLARLQLRQGRRQEAREILSPVYGRFTEGFRTRSLTTARELLAELSSPRPERLALN